MAAHPSGSALGSVVLSGQHFQVSFMVSASHCSPPFAAPKDLALDRSLLPPPCVPQVPDPDAILLQFSPSPLVPNHALHVAQAQSTESADTTYSEQSQYSPQEMVGKKAIADLVSRLSYCLMNHVLETLMSKLLVYTILHAIL